MKLAATVVAVVALVGGTADIVALRPHHAPPADPARGALVSVVLDDGTLLISKRDYQAGIYPIGRRFVPALP
ncbi:MAG: hypothetical protein ACYDA3_01755 [Gaiellaceae bacterium]